MANIFNSIRLKRPKRNVFNLSYENKLTMNMGELVPIMCMPIVPGDKFRVNTEALVRLAPLVAPMMHRVNVYTHYFFVPNRLVWNDWEDFITKGIDGADAPVLPRFSIHDRWTFVQSEAVMKQWFGDSSLWDYMGLPTLAGVGNKKYNISNGVVLPNNFRVSVLPFRAYQLIYNEYYRDQNLTDPVEFGLGSGIYDGGSDLNALLQIRRRAWEKDYFTSALPWLQRGPEVTVPVGGSFGVVTLANRDNNQIFVDSDGNPTQVDVGMNLIHAADKNNVTPGTIQTGLPNGSNSGNAVWLDPKGTLVVDGENSGVSIQDLRTSNALQRWFERNARGGSRYIEQILAHFGVRSSDARLQRPQFLGGGKMPIAVSEVLQTSSTDATSPQANMAGHGISAGVNNGFKHYFEEHGYVIGLMSIMPRTGYQQGVPRDFTKFDNMDFYFPEFAHLSEQEIKNQELFVSNDPTYNEGTFGYTPRYAEYKYHESEAHGDFRGNMSFWHLNRIFTDKPNLNTTFVECNPSNRVFATSQTQDDKFWVQVYQDVKALRLMPKYGTPML
ncbi:major capsid protein [Parabacteroides goldsteinii]|uniref:major capsid protein n=1 Tax=Parabacteroides goldsteinii TaxID=328812 RepID=UPI0032C0A542